MLSSPPTTSSSRGEAQPRRPDGDPLQQEFQVARQHRPFTPGVWWPQAQRAFLQRRQEASTFAGCQLHRCCWSASASRLDLQAPPSAHRARTGNPGARTTNTEIAPPPSAASGLQRNWRPMRPGEPFRLQQHFKPQRGHTLGGDLFLPAHSDHHLHHHLHQRRKTVPISIFINF